MNILDHITKDRRSFDLTSVITLLAITIIAYFNTLNVPFLFDGRNMILDNKILFPPVDYLAIWKIYPARFITMASFALNIELGGLDVRWFHVVNTSIHFFNGLLVFYIGKRLFREGPISWYALVMAAIFVAHPLATQAVTYIWQRSASLVVLFCLGALLAYMQSDLDKKSLWSSFGWKTLSFLLVLLAMFTKQNSFTIPLVIGGYELIANGWRGRKTLVALGPFLALMAVLPLVMKLQGDFTVTKVKWVSELLHSPLEYFMSQMYVIVKYIGLYFVPVGQTFSPDVTAVRSLLDWRFWPGFVLLSLMFTSLVWQWKKRPIVSFGLLIFFMGLAVESSFYPIEDLMFEHRFYLPSIGLLIAIFAIARELIISAKYRYFFVASVIGLVGCLCFLTIQRNKVWQSDEAFWTDVIEKAPNRTRNQIEYANMMLRTKNFDRAIELFEAFIEKHPTIWLPRNNLGRLYLKKGNCKDAKVHLRKAIEINPYGIQPYPALAECLFEDGKKGEAFALLDRAEQFFDEPYLIVMKKAHFHLLNEDFERAVSVGQKAISIDPRGMHAYYFVAQAYFNLDQADKAIATLVDAKKSGAHYPELFYLHGEILEDIGRYDEVLKLYYRVLLDKKEDVVIELKIARVFRKTKQYEKSLRVLNDLNKRYPTVPTVKIGLSETHLAMGASKEARRFLSEAGSLCENVDCSDEIKGDLERIEEEIAEVKASVH